MRSATGATAFAFLRPDAGAASPCPIVPQPPSPTSPPGAPPVAPSPPAAGAKVRGNRPTRRRTGRHEGDDRSGLQPHPGWIVWPPLTLPPDHGRLNLSEIVEDQDC